MANTQDIVILDIDEQSLAGAIGTGTHGSARDGHGLRGEARPQRADAVLRAVARHLEAPLRERLRGERPRGEGRDELRATSVDHRRGSGGALIPQLRGEV